MSKIWETSETFFNLTYMLLFTKNVFFDKKNKNDKKIEIWKINFSKKIQNNFQKPISKNFQNFDIFGFRNTKNFFFQSKNTKV